MALQRATRRAASAEWRISGVLAPKIALICGGWEKNRAAEIKMKRETVSGLYADLCTKGDRRKVGRQPEKDY